MPQKIPHSGQMPLKSEKNLVVSRSQIEMHMHDAYRRIRKTMGTALSLPSFGVFVSGPSKTADIEQALALGAHGCRTLEVFLTP